MKDHTKTHDVPASDALDMMNEHERAEAFQAEFAALCEKYRADFRPTVVLNLTFFTEKAWGQRRDAIHEEAIKQQVAADAAEKGGDGA